MAATIEILQNGQLIETRVMEDGTYTIGRDPSAGIVLNSKTVSKNHAALAVDNNTFRVVDNDSANGIYCRGKKISEKTFKDDFQIELSPFTIRTAVTGESARSEEKAAFVRSLGFFINRNIKVVFSMIIVLGMLLCLLTVYAPLKRKANDLFQQAHLKRGVLLSRYMAEMNRTFLENGEHAWIRTTPVPKEEGVIYAFVVDGYGKIIAPHEKQGDFFNWDGLPQAIKSARPMTGNGPGGEHLIFTPVVFRSQVQGAAIIGFANMDGKPAPGVALGGGTIFLLLILFGMAILAAYVVARNFLTPLRLLYEDIELAIKEGRDHVTFSTPNEELDSLKRIVNRLLLRKTTGPPGLPDADKPEPFKKDTPCPEKKSVSSETPPAEPDASPPVNIEQASTLDGPWCLVDPEDYTLIRFSDTFIRDLDLKECRQGMHIIEAFDSDIIVMVTQVIEHPDGTPLEAESGGRKYRVSGTRQDAEKPTVLIVFEEAGP